MKVIDIMQKLANGENIKKFRINDVNYYVDKSNYICEEDGTRVEWYIDDAWLNMDAEVIEVIEEDKKIRKIKVNYSPDIDEEIFYEDGDKPNHCVLGDAGTKLLINKINEIIDCIMEDKHD